MITLIRFFQTPPTFSLQDWQAVEFSSSGSQLSTVVRSEKGPAFLGEPTSLLLSKIPPPMFPSYQKVQGKVHFLPKKIAENVDLDENSGVSIYLMDKIQDLDSPKIQNSLEVIIIKLYQFLSVITYQVFIGYDGKVKITNGELKNLPYYETKSIGQLPDSDCYGFEGIISSYQYIITLIFSVTDMGWQVKLDAWTTDCGDKKGRKRKKVSLELDTPFQK